MTPQHIFAPATVTPTLAQIQDDLLYNKEQAQHALELGGMRFVKAVRSGRLKKTHVLGRNYFSGRAIKTCALRLRVKAVWKIPKSWVSDHTD